MQLTVEIAARNAIAKPDLFAMHRLRAKVFSDRKRWEVPILGDMEIDGYDAIDPYYMLMRGEQGVVRGCWRLLPTDGPYMLKDTFPEYLHGQAAPQDPHIWELSRFAIESGGEQAFGFSQAAMQSIKEIIRYGHEHGIAHYVTVTATAIERMLKRAGVVTRRMGPPVSADGETAVAIYVDIGPSMQAMHLLN
ncbi:acyl-homoserine-lactone synthase LasI [Pseudoduganella ginsengisoli]|uniref:Acyl-homoserine-lactone synthase n=1 Tax=Pseudoduganella ginsengisoli TaxID=1462440 RepID=A0A6L6Q1Y5_9BURK|nr:acyl-homoserine-lactone synthase [Pseudoduganella ginsengisoli]MTW03640.1 acyl-homoserine-lactone synthase [Pseudoduganella ginsengisoli]